jgi:hypothetical protein
VHLKLFSLAGKAQHRQQMDPHDRALHMREHLKQIYRARLPDIGWCDDNTRRKQQVWLVSGSHT